jgi:hypothetical protein
VEHKKRRSYMSGFGEGDDLFGDLGIGLDLGENVNMGLELVGAGAVGALGVGLMDKAEDMYPAMLTKNAYVTPAIRTLLGAAAGVALSMAKFPGARALSMGLGVGLTASGLMGLKKAWDDRGMSLPTNGMGQMDDREMLYNAPVTITEEQLASAPLGIRDVSATEQQLQDFAFLQ